MSAFLYGYTYLALHWSNRQALNQCYRVVSSCGADETSDLGLIVIEELIYSVLFCPVFVAFPPPPTDLTLDCTTTSWRALWRKPASFCTDPLQKDTERHYACQAMFVACETRPLGSLQFLISNHYSLSVVQHCNRVKKRRQQKLI